MDRRLPALLLIAATAAGMVLSGCSRSTDAIPASGEDETAGAQTAAAGSAAGARAGGKNRTFHPIVLGGAGDAPGGRGRSGEQTMNTVREALDPLQILVGQWRGVTFKKIGGAVSVEQPEWVWDFRTDKHQPALVMTSETSPYLKQARLTYLVDSDTYQLKGTDRNGNERIYEGTFSKPVEDVPGDNNRLQRTFMLELTQVAPQDLMRASRIVLNQQENNRYLLEVHDRRGDQFTKYDTVANQRAGTSFAADLDDYGEKTCIISQGLGTMSVSHNGRTYWVCCSGCKAAFEDDPEKWIARAAQRKE